MERAFGSSSRAAVAVAVATTALLALCCAAARPLGPQEALPPGAGQRRAAGYDDAAARAGKWLPFAGAGGVVPHHHLPAEFWAHKPVPWVEFGAGAHGGSGAFEGRGEGGGHVRGRSYERDDGERDTTRQEQLAMWASLLNPKGERRREATTGWLPAPRIGDEEPAKAAEGTTTEVDDPATSDVQTRSGFYWRNNGN